MAEELGLERDALVAALGDDAPQNLTERSRIHEHRLALAETLAEKRGRPSTFSDEVAEAICMRLVEGRTLVEICRDEDFAPHITTIYDWTEKYPAFARAVYNARKRQGSTIADMALERARDAVGMEGVAQAGVLLKATQWLSAKLDPLGFGERAASERSSLNIADMSESDLEGLMAMASGELTMRKASKPALEAPKLEDDVT